MELDCSSKLVDMLYGKAITDFSFNVGLDRRVHLDNQGSDVHVSGLPSSAQGFILGFRLVYWVRDRHRYLITPVVRS